MALEADDEDEPTGGPPPDPTMRAWRHPSEIASAEAAAARFRQQDARSQPGPAPGAPGHGPLALGFHRPDRGPGRSAFVFLALTAMTAAAALVALAVGSGMFYADVDGASRQLDTGGSTSQFGADAASAAAILPPSEPQSRPATTVVDLSPQDMGAGVYAEVNRVPTRLAGVTVANGTLFTLASALVGQTRITVAVGQLEATAVVVGQDDVSDVAVLRLTGDQADVVLTAMTVTQPASAIHATQVTAGHTSRTRSGDLVYGTLVTNMSCDEAGGMALVGDSGQVIGLILSSASPLVSAVPIDTAETVARSLEAGIGTSAAWIGLNGKVSAKGGVQLTSVSPGSPAATAGLQVGDRLITINGTRVQDWKHLTWLIRQAGTGGTLVIEIERDGARLSRQAIVGTRTPGS